LPSDSEATLTSFGTALRDVISRLPSAEGPLASLGATKKVGSGRQKSRLEMDESYFGGRRKVKRGRGAKGKIPVFGILEREGRVKVEIVKDVTAETLLRETIKKVKRGSIIYTDKFKAYDGLVIYGFKHERIDKSIKFSTGRSILMR
jgi:transposase